MTHLQASLIPMPSHCPVLIACSMRKRREETWFIYSCEWHQCRQSGREVSDRKNEFENLTCSFCPIHLSFKCSQSEKTYYSWFKRKNVCTKCVLLIGESSPSVYLGRHWHHSWWTSPSSFIFPNCKQSKTGQWEGLGTRLYLQISDNSQKCLNYLKASLQQGPILCGVEGYAHWKWTTMCSSI